jgi:hypothetical protein
MKLTTKQLRAIIKEELQNVLQEGYMPSVMMQGLKDKRTGKTIEFPATPEANQIKKYVIGLSTPESRKDPNFRPPRGVTGFSPTSFERRYRHKDTIYYSKEDKKKMDSLDGIQMEKFYDFAMSDDGTWNEGDPFETATPSQFLYNLNYKAQQKERDAEANARREREAKRAEEEERKRKEREAYKQTPEYQAWLDKYVDSVLAPGKGNYVTGRGPQTQTFGKKKKYQAGN